MARPQFESVVAQAPKKYLDVIWEERTDNLAVNGLETVSIYAPPGFVGRLIGMRLMLNKNPAATSGSHSIFLSYNLPFPGGANLDLVSVEYPYNAMIDYSNSNFRGAPTKKEPAEVTGLFLQGITFDDLVPLDFYYVNNTNAATTAKRSYYLSIEYEQIAK